MEAGMSSRLQNYGEENKPPALTTLGFLPVNRCEPLLLSINLHYHRNMSFKGAAFMCLWLKHVQVSPWMGCFPFDTAMSLKSFTVLCGGSR
jgi:hypothetical protein